MDKLFDEYHLPLLKDIDHTALIPERKQNLDADDYEDKFNKEIKLPSNKKEIDLHGSMTYWLTIIKEVINWFNFLNVMEYTAYKIDNEITLLPSLLKMFSMFQMRF